MTTARLREADSVRRFALGGNARFTLVSVKTKTRFTFRVAAPKQSLDGEKTCQEEATLWFVSVLTGADNESAFSYLGCLRSHPAGVRFDHGRKSRLSPDAPSAKAFRWFWGQVAKGGLPECVEVWHEGRCCRCGRALTVPASIASGIGPECAELAGRGA